MFIVITTFLFITIFMTAVCNWLASRADNFVVHSLRAKREWLEKVGIIVGPISLIILMLKGEGYVQVNGQEHIESIFTALLAIGVFLFWLSAVLKKR